MALHDERGNTSLLWWFLGIAFFFALFGSGRADAVATAALLWFFDLLERIIDAARGAL